jgi:hypothetical protein
LRLGLLSFERQVLVWKILLLVPNRLQIVLLTLMMLLLQRHLLVHLYHLFLVFQSRELCP